MKRKKEEFNGIVELENFLASELGKKALAPLRGNACMAVEINGKEIFISGMKVWAEPPYRADFRFWVPLSTLRQLLAFASRPEANLGALGIAVLEAMIQSDIKK